VSNDETGVRVRRDDRVVTVTLDRPADQNRLTRDVLLALQRIADELAGNAHAQAVVVTGSGSEFFSMGILSPAVRAGYTKEQVLLRRAFEWSQDVDEGAAAHSEGRTPRFTGR
jgi:enoyl-CoA hydratase/carnithine racemase